MSLFGDIHPVQMTREQWQVALTKAGHRNYRAEQIFKWVHQRGVMDPALMTDLPQGLREQLATAGFSCPATLDRRVDSADGTRKLVLRLAAGGAIETVLIPANAASAAQDADVAASSELLTSATDHRAEPTIRVTQCISTQVGCAMQCKFCASGAAGLQRHLSTAEIVVQVLMGRQALGPHEKLRNLVIMGMGEPLHNYQATIQAIEVLVQPLGVALSPRRITLSTCGLVPEIRRLGRKFGGAVGLAISLGASTDRQRNVFMPIGRRYPLRELIAAMRDYPLPTGRHLTVEYTLIAGHNDSAADARQLGRLLTGLRVKVNLIPLNPVANSPLRPPSTDKVEAFQRQLIDKGYRCFIRRRRGDDVAAACGQLALAKSPTRARSSDGPHAPGGDSVLSEQTIEQARQWLRHDPDPTTREELQALLDQRATELNERFSGPLVFGTAGLRGILGAGQSRMNRAVVRRTTAGLASYLLEHEGDAARERGVVVGYDGRRLSRTFAEDTAGVLANAGIRVHLSDTVCPTPIVAFAVKELNAIAGIMITASHNPPAYNGYKVYAKNGAQIIPPTDRQIAEGIDRAPPADEVPLLTLEQAEQKGLFERFGQQLKEHYLTRIAQLAPTSGGDRSLTIVYTPLHGVGRELFERALAAAGFAAIFTVKQQAEPDGNFPTVAFPNPEEKGALDLALALATKQDADLVIANDPDADRLAVAVRQSPGKYRQLSGDDVGTLIGHYVLTEASTQGDDRLVVNTVVSSPALGHIAATLGAHYAQTLTGFKWIANRAMQLERRDNRRFVFGYEEALGYTVGTVVRDKDGISAALVVATLAASLRAEGKTLLDRLDDIAREFGLYVSSQRAIVLPGAEGKQQIEGMMNRLREAAPTELAGCQLSAVVDCQQGVRTTPDGQSVDIELPPSNVLVFELEGGQRAIARPSGTEPKIKLYFNVRQIVPDGGNVDQTRILAKERLAQLEKDLMKYAGAES